MIPIVAFIVGLFLGSFLLVVIDRFGTKESIITGRSRCDMCKRKLAWYDLFPLLSFISTAGKGMGFGDVVFAGFMGLLLGYPKVVVALYIAFLSGAIISLFLIGLKKKKLHGSTIPFGPFLVFGTYVCLLYGSQLLTFFLRVL